MHFHGIASQRKKINNLVSDIITEAIDNEILSEYPLSLKFEDEYRCFQKDGYYYLRPPPKLAKSAFEIGKSDLDQIRYLYHRAEKTKDETIRKDDNKTIENIINSYISPKQHPAWDDAFLEYTYVTNYHFPDEPIFVWYTKPKNFRLTELFYKTTHEIIDTIQPDDPIINSPNRTRSVVEAVHGMVLKATNEDPPDASSELKGIEHLLKYLGKPRFKDFLGEMIVAQNRHGRNRNLLPKTPNFIETLKHAVATLGLQFCHINETEFLLDLLDWPNNNLETTAATDMNQAVTQVYTSMMNTWCDVLTVHEQWTNAGDKKSSEDHSFGINPQTFIFFDKDLKNFIIKSRNNTKKVISVGKIHSEIVDAERWLPSITTYVRNTFVSVYKSLREKSTVFVGDENRVEKIAPIRIRPGQDINGRLKKMIQEYVKKHKCPLFLNVDKIVWHVCKHPVTPIHVPMTPDEAKIYVEGYIEEKKKFLLNPDALYTWAKQYNDRSDQYYVYARANNKKGFPRISIQCKKQCNYLSTVTFSYKT